MTISSTRVYTVAISRVTVATAITIIQIVAGATVPLEIVRATATQGGLTTTAMQAIQLNRKTAVATVTSATPLKKGPSTDPAASAIGGAALTGTIATSEGTDGNILKQEYFNILIGWLYQPGQQEQDFVDALGIIGLKFPVAPSSSAYDAEIVFRECA